MHRTFFSAPASFVKKKMKKMNLFCASFFAVCGFGIQRSSRQVRTRSGAVIDQRPLLRHAFASEEGANMGVVPDEESCGGHYSEQSWRGLLELYEIDFCVLGYTKLQNDAYVANSGTRAILRCGDGIHTRIRTGLLHLARWCTPCHVRAGDAPLSFPCLVETDL